MWRKVQFACYVDQPSYPSKKGLFALPQILTDAFHHVARVRKIAGRPALQRIAINSTQDLNAPLPANVGEINHVECDEVMYFRIYIIHKDAQEAIH